MNYNFKDVTDFAEKFTRKESPKASKILDLTIEKSKRDYLNLCFTYLRWVDDFADDPLKNSSEKKSFIERQKNLLTCLYNERETTSEVIEEACIIYFAEYANSSGKKILIEETQNMVKAIKMDVDRIETSGIFSNKDLNIYIELMSKSLFNILYHSSLTNYDISEDYYLSTKFTTLALIIRDLEEDIDLGLINIGYEELIQYEIDFNNIKNDNNLSLWLKDKIKSILSLLDDETSLLKTLPFKFRLITYYSLIYRLPWVVRAKVYKYKLDYISNQTLLKEITTFLLTSLISLKIFTRGFIQPSGKTGFLKLKEAVKTSDIYTRKRSFKLWIISRLLIPDRRRKYSYMCFQYLKWADDYVDDPQNDKQSKLSFIDKQLNLVAELKDGEDSYLQQEEYLLYHLINYALAENKPQIINEIKESLESIKMDAVRIQDDGMFNQDELSLYLRKVVQPVFNLTYYFLKPSAKLSDKDNYIGKFVWQVLIIRDFFEDIDSGYINIPHEEITKYNLDPDNLKKDENRFLWFKEKYPEYIKTLEDDIRIFRKMPLKIKLFWAPIYPYMIYELLKVKEYNYYFGDKHSKSIIKELKILGKTALSVTGFYLKIFI